MSEKILEIKEVSINTSRYSGMDGFVIKTDKQEIQILIDNDQNCCESWGYLSTNDDEQEFVGADLLDIVTVDESLNTKVYDHTRDLDSGEAVFVNLETNKGTLQFVVYNEHNGYYGHSIKIKSEQFNLEKTL